jgi:hypothetical protein
MADPKTTWNDFYNQGLGPELPLSYAARMQGVSGVLPSGESNGLDFVKDSIRRK